MLKKQKLPKLVSSKKVPKLYRKKYTTKKLEKKIYKKLYIEKDLKFVKSFFKEKETGIYTAIFPEKMLKTDVLRLKKLAKQIKKQKGRIKILPLIAVFIAIAIIMIAVIFGKNIFVKTILQKNLESVFEAKTTIEQVNVELLNSRISIHNLTIANKDAPMKNLFDVGKIELDFNLTQLLRGRFVSENIEASAMQFGTNRKTSGALPSIKNDAKTTSVEKENTIKNAELKSTDSLKMQITDLFDNYDPKTIIEESTNELKTPEVAEKTEQQIKEIVLKWQEEPDKLQSKVTIFNTSANKVINKNYASIKDPIAIKDALADINDSLQQAQELKNEIDVIRKNISTDRATVDTLSTTLQNVINNDKDIVDNKINAIKSISAEDSKTTIINNLLESVGLVTVKKYLPYINKAIKIANSMKKEKNSQNTEQSKSRLAGRNVYYKKNMYPTFLIEKIQCSGPEFSAIISDISNDANLWGKPIIGKAEFSKEALSHTVLATVDTRSITMAPLISVNYAGNGYKFSINAKDISSKSVGIPSIKGDNTVTINTNANTDGSFSGSGLFKLTNLNLITESFDPEWGYNIYNNALQNIKTMAVSANFEFNPDTGISLYIKNDADDQIQKTLASGINSVLDDVKITAKKQAIEELKKYAEEYENQLKNFNNTDLLLKQISIDSTISKLDEKKDELTNQATEKTQKVIEDKAKDLIKGFGF